MAFAGPWSGGPRLEEGIGKPCEFVAIGFDGAGDIFYRFDGGLFIFVGFGGVPLQFE